MVVIDEIKARVEQDDFVFTKHAVDRTLLRGIQVSEVREALMSGEIIEDYPDDKYGPSCLILGFTTNNRPLHVQIAYTTEVPLKLITVYEPDPHEWIDFRMRR
jgi:hypothetical protein